MDEVAVLVFGLVRILDDGFARLALLVLARLGGWQFRFSML
jgi:hypothetical protein